MVSDFYGIQVEIWLVEKSQVTKIIRIHASIQGSFYGNKVKVSLFRECWEEGYY